MKELIFEKGEIRKLEFQAHSNIKNDAIIITSAKWELINVRTKTVIANGKCEINSDKIIALVNFDTIGIHHLEITAEIPPETIIERIDVRVVD